MADRDGVPLRGAIASQGPEDMSSTAAAPAPSLTITRRIGAPAAAVYRAWTDAAALARWWAPAGGTVVRAEIDARVDGRFRIVVRAADGEEHDVGGVYREVVPDARLVFSWAWRSTPERVSEVTVELVPDGDETILTLHHARFFDEAARDRHRRGWTMLLERLATAAA